MGSKLYYVLFWLALLTTINWFGPLGRPLRPRQAVLALYCLSLPCSPHSTLDHPILQSSEWNTMESQKPVDESQVLCQKIKPSARDIIRRIYAVLPYLDREHQNAQLIHMYRSTMTSMSEGEDMLDQEAVFYTAVLTPLIFLQHYRDAWCLLERFHQAILRYQVYTPAEKRTAIKPLQNLRDLNNKIRLFIDALPAKYSPNEDRDETGSFLKDVINNLE